MNHDLHLGCNDKSVITLEMCHSWKAQTVCPGGGTTLELLIDENTVLCNKEVYTDNHL